MEAYLAKRPSLKEGTKKSHKKRYNDMLNYLKQTNNIEKIDIDIINNEIYSDLIKEYINTKSLPSRCPYISTIQFIISPIRGRPINKNINLYEYWKKYFYDTDNKYRSKQANQIKTDKQKKKWLEWEIILKFRKNLKKSFRKKKINILLKSKYKKNIDDINIKVDIIKLITDNFFQYQYYLMLCMHTYIEPVRTEYSEMIICSWDYYRNLNHEETYINTYLINNKRKTKRIVFGKNARKNKMKKNLIIELPKELCSIINTFIDMRNILFNFTIKNDDTIPLFYKHTRFPNKCGNDLSYGMEPNLYSKNFISFMDRNLGKKIGVSLLRTIYTSYDRRGEKSLEDKKKTCLIMNHSPNTQELYYLKHD